MPILFSQSCLVTLIFILYSILMLHSSFQIHVESLSKIENFVVSDLLIGVPVSFLFPTIGFNTIYRKSGKQERRMEDRDPEEDWRRNPLLSRLDFFFRSLELDDTSCQQKLICELVQRPDKFSPISDLLMSIFR